MHPGRPMPSPWRAGQCDLAAGVPAVPGGLAAAQRGRRRVCMSFNKQLVQRPKGPRSVRSASCPHPSCQGAKGLRANGRVVGPRVTLTRFAFSIAASRYVLNLVARKPYVTPTGPGSSEQRGFRFHVPRKPGSTSNPFHNRPEIGFSNNIPRTGPTVPGAGL